MISGQSEPRDFVQVNPAFALDVHQPRALFVLTQARITGEQKLASPVRNNPFEEFLVGGAKGPFALDGSLRMFKRPFPDRACPFLVGSGQFVEGGLVFDPRARSKSRQRSVSHSTRASATVAPQAFKQPLCPAVQFGASQTRVPVAHPKMEQGHWSLCNCVWAGGP